MKFQPYMQEILCFKENIVGDGQIMKSFQRTIMESAVRAVRNNEQEGMKNE